MTVTTQTVEFPTTVAVGWQETVTVEDLEATETLAAVAVVLFECIESEVL